MILLHDKQTLLDLKWEILPHSAHFPDIAPSDFHLFRSMKHVLAGTNFRNETEVRKWVVDFIASKDEEFFRQNIYMLPKK